MMNGSALFFCATDEAWQMNDLVSLSLNLLNILFQSMIGQQLLASMLWSIQYEYDLTWLGI